MATEDRTSTKVVASTATSPTSGGFRFDGVYPGPYRLRLEAAGRPRWSTRQHELVQDGTWRAGNLVWPQAGRIEVQAEPRWPAGMMAFLYRSEEWAATVWQGPPYQSPPLAAGDYRVRVQGPGIATMALECAVVPDASTVVRIRPEMGYRQHFELATETEWQDSTVRVLLHWREEPPVVRLLSVESDAPACFSESLRPGEHSMVVEAGRHRREWRFTVTRAGGEVVRLAMP